MLPLVWILYHSIPPSRQLERARTLFKLAEPQQWHPLFVVTTLDSTVSTDIEILIKCYFKSLRTNFIESTFIISVYLDLPSSALTPSNVQLMFSFGAVTATRSWNIKIAMLPCGASYLGKPAFIQLIKQNCNCC